jgi:hypothetical protein
LAALADVALHAPVPTAKAAARRVIGFMMPLLQIV